jgi:capsid protein
MPNALTGQLLGPDGKLLKTAEREQADMLQAQMAQQMSQALGQYRQQQLKLFQERRMIRAKFDAAQTFSGNENHWSNADNLDPHQVASLSVRRRLRSRSRYEIVENNPYLKGTILSLVNDFVGIGPSLIITDERLSEKRRRSIQDRWQEWAYACNIRQKLWRMRMHKIVDGESFAIPYINYNRRSPYPVLLDFHIIECDRVSSHEVSSPETNPSVGQIDGVKFDAYENPTHYHILYRHPGGSGEAYPLENAANQTDGTWIPAKFVIHWFRQDRGWLRGIPETTPSLPLCALLRRYTLSIVRHAEVVSDITVLLETQNPASPAQFQNPTPSTDEPFDLFPIEMGMMMNLPLGYQMKQLEPVPLGTQYDEFVGSILREICRPILAPYNIVSGTSKDSNMASAVVDQNIYKGGQEAERFSCDCTVLDHMTHLWWNEASLLPNYLSSDIGDLTGDRSFTRQLPKHEWRWPKIGLDHTDPSKVAESLKTLHDKGFILDADVQKLYFNRDYNTWKQQVLAENAFRQELKPMNPEDNPDNMPKPAARPAANGKPASNGSARK